VVEEVPNEKIRLQHVLQIQDGRQVRFCAEIGLYGLEASQGVLRGPRPRTEQFVPVLIVEEAVPELEAQLGRDRRSL
jgi:hypothetical protein